MLCPSKVLVVGSAGFIGRKLSLALKQNCEVVEIPGRSSWNSFNLEYSNLSSFDAIYWCASTVNPATATLHPHLVAMELDTWNSFLDSLASLSKVKTPKVIFVSSGGCIYTDIHEPFAEDSQALGTNDYGRMKLEQELLLRQLDLDFAILRAGNVYGPGQVFGKGQGVIANWINSCLQDGKIEVFGSQESARDYVFIEDFIDAAILVGTTQHGIFNVASGRQTSLREVVEIFRKLVGGKLQILYGEPRVFDRISYSLDISKIKKTTGWTPVTDLADGIKISLQSSNLL